MGRTATRALAIGLAIVAVSEVAMGAEVSFEVMGEEPEANRYRACRSMIVGPWKNQPEEYEGYNGFVGWPGVARLASGRWIVTFTSGAWHATAPWTEEIREDPESRAQFEAWHKLGLPDVRAPRGGRCHIMYSDDEGLTWSAPATLVDTEGDDRHPTIVELDNGDLVCTFFAFRFPREASAKYMLSHDGGETWDEPRNPLDAPGPRGFGNGPLIQLARRTLIWVAEGRFDEAHPHSTIGVMRSSDRGASFELASIVKRDHELNEPTVAQLPDGRLVMAIRREGDLCWSDDGGETWTHSGSTGWDVFDPHLVYLPNGVLAWFHGSYQKGGIRVLLSPDGGRTWHGPGERYGYAVDPSVYGYCHPMILADGTVYLVYIHTGGHRPGDARTEALWGLRVRVHDDAGGIDILPAPGSVAAHSARAAGAPRAHGNGGDPELGDKM
ncbi:MAG: exo-alpha-sialidase [Candidatus Hydrogenedentes bacterium]|nr:exo-alpha-sialidase [Candidatus Hydrogenedentota bacterium]